MNCIDIVNLFLSQKIDDKTVVDVNQKNSLNKKTGLHFACENDSIDLVILLLSTGKVKLDEMDSENLTPIQYAQLKKNDEIIQLLTKNMKNVYP